MTTSDWVMVLAIVTAPVIAVQVSKWLERSRERQRRRLEVFQTLMATRAVRVSPSHVQALNSIDIEFHGSRLLGRFVYQRDWDLRVLESWQVYRTHLNTAAPSQLEDEQKTWNLKAGELLSDLLYNMARALGYAFDKALIERGIYFPEAHGNLELDQLLVRKFMVDVALQKKAIPITALRELNMAHSENDDLSRSDQVDNSLDDGPVRLAEKAL